MKKRIKSLIRSRLLEEALAKGKAWSWPTDSEVDDLYHQLEERIVEEFWKNMKK